MKMKHRHYKTERGAATYARKLNAQLDEVNAKRVAKDQALSLVDFYYVVTDRFGYAVAVSLSEGKQYLCA